MSHIPLKWKIQLKMLFVFSNVLAAFENTDLNIATYTYHECSMYQYT